jgi:hypothetical protein
MFNLDTEKEICGKAPLLLLQQFLPKTCLLHSTLQFWLCLKILAHTPTNTNGICSLLTTHPCFQIENRIPPAYSLTLALNERKTLGSKPAYRAYQHLPWVLPAVTRRVALLPLTFLLLIVCSQTALSFSTECGEEVWEETWCRKGNCSKAKFSSGGSKPQIGSPSRINLSTHSMRSRGHWIICSHFLS